jgi:hypothetical protein
MSTNHETLRRLIHGHFDGWLDPADEARLRAHLPVCAECRQIYQCHQVAERLDPAAPSSRERLALALGLPSEMRRPLRRSSAWALASLAVAGAVALTVMGKPHGDDGITSRGAAALKAEAVDFAIFRINGQGESTRVNNAITADDELAFAYRNEVGKTFLMIFAVDGQNRVMWYHPAWTSSEDNPQALPITKQVGFKELPEAVRHRLQGASLTMYALFMDTPLDVRAVESRVARGAFSAHAEAGEILRTLVLEVRP